jgi:ketosteroid isomerase-like protein
LHEQSLVFLCAACTLASCDIFTKKKPVAGPDNKQQMINADIAFSKLSVEKGVKHAFLEYLDSNGVLLKPGNFPIVGADAIDYLIQMDDSAYTLQWRPRDGMVAQSGELGYTFGVYALKPSAKDTVIYGTYVSIWKKQGDGSWKFVLDSGNEGVGETEEE